MFRLLLETNTQDVKGLTVRVRNGIGYFPLTMTVFTIMLRLRYLNFAPFSFSMNPKISKSQAEEKINSFFQNKGFSQKQMKKIKRLAMKFKIKLCPYKKYFCKKCLSPLKGKIRITKTHKTIECSICSYRNKFKYKSSFKPK